MSKKMAFIIVTHGIVLAGLGLGLRSVAPELAKTPSLISLGGGGVCAVWGFLALAGYKSRAGILLTLAAIGLALLAPTLDTWLTSAGAGATRWLLTTMLLVTLGQLLYVMHGERPPDFYEKSPRQPGTGSQRTS
jgi:hypothetical protein